MRLDSYLVEKNLLSSRMRAVAAVKKGHIRINGKTVMKPSYDIVSGDTVDIEAGIDRPQGYWKLKNIDERLHESGIQLLSRNDSVLDIGSSAGGFLLYASEKTAWAVGIEFSTEFKGQLSGLLIANNGTNNNGTNNNISVVFGDVFTCPIKSTARFDVLFNDTTLKPADSLTVFKNSLQFLKDRGMFLQVIKLPKKQDINPLLAIMKGFGTEILRTLESDKKEVYVIGNKKSG